MNHGHGQEAAGQSPRAAAARRRRRLGCGCRSACGACPATVAATLARPGARRDRGAVAVVAARTSARAVSARLCLVCAARRPGPRRAPAARRGRARLRRGGAGRGPAVAARGCHALCAARGAGRTRRTPRAARWPAAAVVVRRGPGAAARLQSLAPAPAPQAPTRPRQPGRLRQRTTGARARRRRGRLRAR